MQAHPFGSRREISIFRMIHALKLVDPFLIVRKDLSGHDETIVLFKLAPVDHV
jgi:hypothetical protein